MIRLEHIHRHFQVGDQVVHALEDINLKINNAEYISIMGPSGSGKSTLLNLVGLLDQPSSGHYLIDGQDVTTLSSLQQAQLRNRKIGFVFQAFHLVPRLTAAENIELPLVLAGRDPDERKQTVLTAMKALGLEDRAHHKADQLSGGQRQRVAIARATIMQPEIILADEPTGNLDHRSGNDVIHILEALNQDGMTLIIVTHDPEVGKRARRRIVMQDGRLASDDIQTSQASVSHGDV